MPMTRMLARAAAPPSTPMSATRMARRRCVAVAPASKAGLVAFGVVVTVVVEFVWSSGAVAATVVGTAGPKRERGLAMRMTPVRATREASCSVRVKGSLIRTWQM